MFNPNLVGALRSPFYACTPHSLDLSVLLCCLLGSSSLAPPLVITSSLACLLHVRPVWALHVTFRRDFTKGYAFLRPYLTVLSSPLS